MSDDLKSQAIWATVVALFFAGFFGMCIRAGAGNDVLQKDYNKSLVECVKAGAGPEDCARAL